MAIEEKVGFCTLCRSRCGAINVVEDGRLVAVKPNPAHPTGRALCPKGRAAPEIAHSARRLATPLRRTAPKGAADPGFVPIGWDEALDEIAGRLSCYAAETGPESVAFAVTSGSSSSMSDSVDWVQRFIRGFGSPNTVYSTEICNWHKDNAHAFTFGCGLPTADYRNAELILLWGHNPANVWLAQAEGIGAARAQGAKVVVIDPRQAGSGRDADLWLRIRPGTDGALAMGLAHLLIRSGTYDRDFVARYTNAPLLVRDDDGRFLRGADIGLDDAEYLLWDETAGAARPAGRTGALGSLSGAFAVGGPAGPIPCRTAFDHYREAVASYAPDAVERITGIPAAQVEALAALIGGARAYCYHGWTGIGQHTNATQTERAVATLYALTGSFDAPGGNQVVTGVPTPALHSMAMMGEAQRAKALGLTERPLGPPADGWITSTDFYDAALTGLPYPVRALVAFGSNLLVSHPAPERGRAALAALDFHVHVDLFPNPTSAFADIVLPASSPWENEALRLGFEITPEAQELVQLRQPIIPRQGETRSDVQILFALATRLGMGELFFGGDVEAGWNHQLAPLGLDVATLRANRGGLRVPVVQRARKYRETGFATETGRVELYSERFLRHGQPPVPAFVSPADAPDADYPLRLLSANSGYFCHSQHRGIAALRRRRAEPVAEISPAVAAARGIADGDAIRIRTRRGEIALKVRLEPTLAEDVVASDYGWWQGAPDLGLPDYPLEARRGLGANFNGLIDERQRDPISGSLALRSSACEIALDRPRPWTGFRPLRVSERRRETDGVVALTLAPIDDAPLAPFRPGQFITVRVGGAIRSYSLIGRAEACPGAYEIAVRRIEDGTVSARIADGVAVGDGIEVQVPAGSFLLPVANAFPVVLVAGGIGITPFLSYLETLTGAPHEPRVTLYYGARNAAAHAFRERIKFHAARLPNLAVVTSYSRPDPGDDATDREGRIGAESIDAALIAARARFYLCAGDAMMSEITAGLRQRGVHAFEIFRENFRSPGRAAASDAATWRVELRRSQRTLTWTPETPSILALAEGEGIKLPTGCRVGQCENCLVQIISGLVSHTTASDAVEEGECLTCQAIPLSDIVLEI